jgi:pimeloyl-ACP methyl ester carboxylesterase
MIAPIKNLAIPGSRQKPILLDIFMKENGIKKTPVIFVHGFKGFKDWGHFNFLAQHFAASDFVFIKFNFSYNGTTPENPVEFGDLEAFGNNNYITELDDLKLVMDFVLSDERIKKELDAEKLALIGHSRGGGISVLKAAEDARVKKLVTWAAVSDFLNRNKQSTIKEWKEKGVVHTFNARTKQNMPLYYQFYETLQNNKQRLDIPRAAASLKIPYLIIHGDADEAVSVSDARQLHKACRHSQLLIIEDGTHTFGISHPFGGSALPSQAEKVIEQSIRFLR